MRPGPDMDAGYENLAGFWPGPGPGPDMISGATLVYKLFHVLHCIYICVTSGQLTLLH